MSRGITIERAVARELRAHDYLVASRRHIGGAGDLVALVEGPDRHRGMLIEVKATVRAPWHTSDFGPDDRKDLVETAWKYDLDALLAWRPPGLGATIWLPSSDWPHTEIAERSYRVR